MSPGGPATVCCGSRPPGSVVGADCGEAAAHPWPDHNRAASRSFAKGERTRGLATGSVCVRLTVRHVVRLHDAIFSRPAMLESLRPLRDVPHTRTGGPPETFPHQQGRDK